MVNSTVARGSPPHHSTAAVGAAEGRTSSRCFERSDKVTHLWSWTNRLGRFWRPGELQPGGSSDPGHVGALSRPPTPSLLPLMSDAASAQPGPRRHGLLRRQLPETVAGPGAALWSLCLRRSRQTSLRHCFCNLQLKKGHTKLRLR